MKVLLIGSSGLLGGACKRKFDAEQLDCDAPSSANLDLTNKAQLEAWLANNYDWCVNCAAFALFNQCEEDPDKAESVNAAGPFNLASACKRNGTRLIHFSSDFVFDGKKGRPYKEADKTHPLSAYGRSKLKGEMLVASASPQAIVLRTSWLYGIDGPCFVRKIVDQLRSEKEIRVVADQFGTPTSTNLLAITVYEAMRQGLPGGVFHAAGYETVSWHQLASKVAAIYRVATRGKRVAITPITTEEWPASAIRPRYSPLDSSKLNGHLTGVNPVGLDDALTDTVITMANAVGNNQTALPTVTG